MPRTVTNQTKPVPQRPAAPTTSLTATRGVPPPTLPKPHVPAVLSIQAVIADLITPQSGPTIHLLAGVMTSPDRNTKVIEMINTRIGEAPFSARVVGLLAALDAAILPHATDDALLTLKSECEMYVEALDKVEKPVAPPKHRTLGKMTPHYSKGEHEAYEQALALYPGDAAKALAACLSERVHELAKLGSHDDPAKIWRVMLNTASSEIVSGVLSILWAEVARDVNSHHRTAVRT